MPEEVIPTPPAPVAEQTPHPPVVESSAARTAPPVETAPPPPVTAAPPPVENQKPPPVHNEPLAPPTAAKQTMLPGMPNNTSGAMVPHVPTTMNPMGRPPLARPFEPRPRSLLEHILSKFRLPTREDAYYYGGVNGRNMNMPFTQPPPLMNAPLPPTQMVDEIAVVRQQQQEQNQIQQQQQVQQQQQQQQLAMLANQMNMMGPNTPYNNNNAMMMNPQQQQEAQQLLMMMLMLSQQKPTWQQQQQQLQQQQMMMLMQQQQQQQMLQQQMLQQPNIPFQYPLFHQQPSYHPMTMPNNYYQQMAGYDDMMMPRSYYGNNGMMYNPQQPYLSRSRSFNSFY